MPTVYKVLGQSAPAATTNTTVYTVPASTAAVVSTISICNRAATSATYRVAIATSATPTTDEYIVYDSAVAGNDTIFITIGATMQAAEKVVVYASTANLSFGVFGSEIS